VTKIIVKNQYNNAEYSTNDLTPLYAVAVSITNTITDIHKKHRKALVGIREHLNVGEVISVGNIPKKYRIVSVEGPVKGKIGKLYRIKRVDGAFITEFDAENSPVGSKVKVLTRKSYEQLRNLDKFSNGL
jgi:hypothetical protein